MPMGSRTGLPIISLQFVKKIVVQFCPWERNVRSTRNFLSAVGSISTRATNPDCKIQTVVKSDGSAPQIDIDYVDGKRLVFKSTHLTALEMLQKFHRWNKVREVISEDNATDGTAKR